MNTLTLVGILLIALGVVGLIYGGISYTSSRDIMEMGPMHVQVDQRRQIPLSPIAGGAAVVVGVILIFLGRHRPIAGSA